MVEQKQNDYNNNPHSKKGGNGRHIEVNDCQNSFGKTDGKYGEDLSPNLGLKQLLA